MSSLSIQEILFLSYLRIKKQLGIFEKDKRILEGTYKTLLNVCGMFNQSHSFLPNRSLPGDKPTICSVTSTDDGWPQRHFKRLRSSSALPSTSHRTTALAALRWKCSALFHLRGTHAWCRCYSAHPTVQYEALRKSNRFIIAQNWNASCPRGRWETMLLGYVSLLEDILSVVLGRTQK